MKKKLLTIVILVASVIACLISFILIIKQGNEYQQEKLKNDISEVTPTITVTENTSETSTQIITEDNSITTESTVTELTTDSTEITELTTKETKSTTESKKENKKKEEKKTTSTTSATTEIKTETTTETPVATTEEITTEMVTELQISSTEVEPVTTEEITTEEVTTEVATEKTTEKTDDDPYCGLSAKDFNDICKVVECETHGADTTSKMHIVNVIRNRKNNSRFPNTYHGVIYQANQFGHRSGVTEHTKEAVRKALRSADNTNGALWFCTCARGCWASRHATRLFKDDVGHIFWK